MKSKIKIYMIIGGALILTSILIKNNFDFSKGEGYLINKNGKTYGSNKAYTVGYEPDLILAEGDDGTKGYIKAEELNGLEFKTPEETIAWQNSKTILRILLLYDKDEENVIGTFALEK